MWPFKRSSGETVALTKTEKGSEKVITHPNGEQEVIHTPPQETPPSVSPEAKQRAS